MRKILIAIASLAVVLGGVDLAPAAFASSTGGMPDDAFNAAVGTTPDGPCYTVAVTPDGHIIAGGGFTGYLKEFDSSGVEVTSFTTNVGSTLDGYVGNVAVTPDGHIIVAGGFTGYLKEFDSTGTEVTNFATHVNGIFDNSINGIAVTPDGHIIVGGDFTGFLKEFNSTGTEVTSFATNVGSSLTDTVYSVAMSPDGHIIVGSYANGRLKEFDSTGTEVTSFATNVGISLTFAVRAVAVTSDGHILAGGDFAGRLKEFDSTGTEVPSFATNMGNALDNNVINTSVSGIAITSDDHIIVIGIFTGYLKELDSSGKEVTSFTDNLGSALNDGAGSVAVTPDGSIVIGGGFITPGRYLARLFGDSIAASSGPNIPIASLQAYAIGQSDTCGTNVPSSVTLPGLVNLQNTGWSKSWQQWPGNGAGGYVCTRQPYFTTLGTWAVQ